jgi:hypothetical protein
VSLRGLEMLLVLTGCLLFFGVFTGNLQLLDILWAFGGIATVLAITAGVMRALFPYLKETRRWERFTEGVGKSLALHSRGGVQRPSLSGQVADCHVTISPVDREHLIVVSVPPSLAQLESHEITLEPRSDLNEDQPSLSLGDPEFDTEVVLRGNLPEVVAVLDATTRAMVLELMRDLSVEVRRRQVMKYGRHLELDPEGTWASVQRMAKLAHRLFRLVPRQAQKKLADNAEDDPCPKVRAMNLRLLFEYYPPSERAILIGRRALQSDDIDCVLAGAVGLAEAGNAEDKELAFRHLADIAALDIFSDEIRSEAIDELAILFPEQAKSVLRGIERETGPLPSTLIPSMVTIGMELDLDHLIRRAVSATDMAQIQILRRLPREPRFEPLACAMFESMSEEVQLEAVEHATHHGTIRAVEGLLPLTRGILRSKSLRERAQQAIDAIQARVTSGGGGALSLTERGRGELSFGAEAGRLSYGDD